MKQVSSDHGGWKSLYLAAIRENDHNTLRHRISEAENAVIARARELFDSGGPHEEQEALEDALYVLRAFRSPRENTHAA